LTVLYFVLLILIIFNSRWFCGLNLASCRLETHVRRLEFYVAKLRGVIMAQLSNQMLISAILSS